MALINCPSCGEQISDSVKTCIHCGRKLTEAEKAKNILNKDIADVKGFFKKHKKPVKIIALILLILMVIYVFVYTVWYNSALQKAKRLAEADWATAKMYEQMLEQY